MDKMIGINTILRRMDDYNKQYNGVKMTKKGLKIFEILKDGEYTPIRLKDLKNKDEIRFKNSKDDKDFKYGAIEGEPIVFEGEPAIPFLEKEK